MCQYVRVCKSVFNTIFSSETFLTFPDREHPRTQGSYKCNKYENPSYDTICTCHKTTAEGILYFCGFLDTSMSKNFPGRRCYWPCFHWALSSHADLVPPPPEPSKLTPRLYSYEVRVHVLGTLKNTIMLLFYSRRQSP